MRLSRGVVVVCAVIATVLPGAVTAAPTEVTEVAAAEPQRPVEAGQAAAAVQAVAASPTTATAATVAAPAPAPDAPAASDPGAVPPPATVASRPKLDGATYAVRLRDLEARVDELKEQIRRSHTRLSLLSDTILSGGMGGARAAIRFRNDMSGAFRLTRALFVLDGAVQYNKQDDTGALSGQKEIPIFNGTITPGDHTLQILLRLRGHGYGVFSYLRGYQFEVRESHSFSVTEGKEIDLEVIAWEKGGVTTPLEERPDVRYNKRLVDVTGPAPAAAVPAGAPPAAREGQ